MVLSLVKEHDSSNFLKAARLWGIENPETTICNPRALLGRKWSDESVQILIKDLPYKVISDHQDRPVFNINVGDNEKTYTVEYVTSLLVKELKHMAEVAMGGNETVTEAVIAIPSNYNDQQRQAVKDAGYLAGIDDLLISLEPGAAAMGYGAHEVDEERNIIIFDIGNTLDVSVLNAENGVFETLASSHYDIGGEHFNQRIIDYITRQWRKMTSIDLTTSPSDMRKLNLEVERAKISLSSNRTAIVDLGSVNSTLTATLTRAKFEELVKDLFVEAVEVIQPNLNKAELNFTDIDDIIITGGSGNIPKIREMVQEAFSGKMPSYGLRSKAAVIGAARRGAISYSDEGLLCGLSFPDLSPLDFGIETADGVTANVAPQKPIPFLASWNFTTAVDRQSSMLIRVLEGQRVLAANNLVIGEFELPLTPAPAGVPRVEIAFRIGPDQDLEVTATDLETKNTKSIFVDPSTTMWTDYGAPEGTKFEGAFLGNWPDTYIDPDPELRARVNARVDLESYLAALKERLTSSEEWGTEDIVRYNKLGHPFQLSKVLQGIDMAQEDIAKHRDTWEPDTFQKLKEDFSILAELFVGKLEYEVIYRVGGKVGVQHDEL
ncbi:hypothetical protein GQX73_g4623 [Xylaria multiplex]|uniref:Uncharacterized protein n=1 Tax=Xylaria multiplex TaxID=323545 RepID=A0A7C8MUJ9_9PEZI|nr:hypothetical protein GQX73_g4623 [Xylaria multiplex]